MLFIIFEPSEGRFGLRLGWHVGERLDLSWAVLTTVATIQADGDELEHIRAILPALTPASGKVISWFGDIARTIASTL